MVRPVYAANGEAATGNAASDSAVGRVQDASRYGVLDGDAGRLEDDPLAVAAYEYGRHLGLAFQVIDDLLDYTVDSETLGKPAGGDLAGGLITAPAFYLLEDRPDLLPLIERRCKVAGDCEIVMEALKQPGSTAFARTQALADSHATQARAALDILSPSPYKDALEAITYKVTARKK